MIQILQPLKVGNSYTAGIQIHVLHEEGGKKEVKRGGAEDRQVGHRQTGGALLTGITKMFLSKKMRSASGVVGPFAPSAMI